MCVIRDCVWGGEAGQDNKKIVSKKNMNLTKYSDLLILLKSMSAHARKPRWPLCRCSICPFMLRCSLQAAILRQSINQAFPPPTDTISMVRMCQYGTAPTTLAQISWCGRWSNWCWSNLVGPSLKSFDFLPVLQWHFGTRTWLSPLILRV